MEIEEKKGRGGRREGAGRKKTGSKGYSFRAPKDVVEILEGIEDKKQFIVDAIRAFSK